MFYERLDKTLKEKNLTLNKLAKGCNIAQSPTTRWKDGTLPCLDSFRKICRYLDVSADYLLGLENTPPPVLTEQEKILLEYFRKCSPQIRKSIMRQASSGATEARRMEAVLQSRSEVKHSYMKRLAFKSSTSKRES